MFWIGSRIQSDQQRALRINSRLRSMMFDSTLPLVAQKIKAEAVVFQVGEFEQIGPKLDPLVVLKQAFENRVLHTLPVVEASFSHAAEPAFAIGCGS